MFKFFTSILFSTLFLASCTEDAFISTNDIVSSDLVQKENVPNSYKFNTVVPADLLKAARKRFGKEIQYKYDPKKRAILVDDMIISENYFVDDIIDPRIFKSGKEKGYTVHENHTTSSAMSTINTYAPTRECFTAHLV